MAQDLQRIRRFVSALIWRERALLIARVALQGALVLLAVLVTVLAAAAFRVDRNLAVAAVVVVSGIGAWAAVAMPLILSWRDSGDRLRQARLAEALESGFRGRLVTAVERVDGASPGESEALLGLVARRAAETATSVRPGRVHRAGRLIFLTVVTGACWFLLLPISLLVPGGPLGTFAWWTSGLDARAVATSLELEADVDHAWVGDLVLRYTYPDYTGLEPREVPNSTGEAAGPPGTRVQVVARTDRATEAAALVAYDEPALDAVVSDGGREISGSFTIQPEEGAYHLVLYRDGQPSPSKDFKIVSEPDLPPEVLVESDAETLELAVDESFGLPWRARDDYGVLSVGLAIDGRPVAPLARPSERRAEVYETFWGRPRDLGLKAGDKVSLTVFAMDNDTYSGSKRGSSQVIELVVLGPRGVGARTAERQEELRNTMLDILADFLVEPWPAGDTSGEMAAWGEDVSQRYRPLEDLAMELWAGFEEDSVEYRAVMDTMDAAKKLIRYTQVAFDPRSSKRPREQAFQVTAELRDTSIVTLEDGILALDRVLRIGALNEMKRQAEALDQLAKGMEELLKQENPDAQELLARLDQLERMMEQLMRESARLSEGGLKEFLNQRQNEALSLQEEIRKALAEGKTEEARELMERLAEQIQQMSQGIDENLEQMQGDSNDQMENAKSLTEDLEKLEQRQRDLQSQVQTLREQGDRDNAEKAADLWEKVQKKVAETGERTEQYQQSLEDNGRSFNEQQRAEQARHEMRAVEDAAQARDMTGAQDALQMAQRAMESVERAYIAEKMMRGDLPGPGQQELGQLGKDLRELQALLEQLERTSQQTDPRVQQQAKRLEEEQEQLEGELEHLQEQAMELSKDFPVHPRNMEQALEQANQRMEQAGQELGQGKPMQAEGAQGAAAERIKEAREALEDAMQSAQQQMQQGKSRGQEPKGKEPGEDGSSDGDKMREQSLPIPEDHLTPEEYRRALLEGMEGDVPEEYRALKKRYYEELVNL